jgi:uncharacterized protein (TIGR00255 family)
MEAVVREQIKRGTVQVSLQVQRSTSAEDYSLNASVLEGYRRQIQALQQRWGTQSDVSLEHFLSLPGVVNEKFSNPNIVNADWPVIESTLQSALAHLAKMRRDEGKAMSTDLASNCAAIGKELSQISSRAPSVVAAYRTRLEERVRAALEEHKLALNPADLVREIAIYTERGDISEELVRLESHLEQFQQIMASEDSAGRKLEFLTQEMLREVNTIGSKSTDVEIARGVIEMKTSIDRLREMIQNVE